LASEDEILRVREANIGYMKVRFGCVRRKKIKKIGLAGVQVLLTIILAPYSFMLGISS
jgi:hypothetical protein